MKSLNVSSPTVHKPIPFSSSNRSVAQTPGKTLFSTPRKARSSLPDSHPSVLDPYDAPPASVSPHPYVFKNAVGPTPQRDGKVLGLFDLLSTSGSTPSTRKRKADTLEGGQNGKYVAQTPSRKPTKGNGDLLDYLDDTPGARRHSRTPASDGKKFLLSQFFATPSTMRFAAVAEEDTIDAIGKIKWDRTPLRSKVLDRDGNKGPTENATETTPAFLRRGNSFNQRLAAASSSKSQQIGINGNLTFVSPSTVRTGPKVRQFKGRALSEILRNLRQMEDNDDEDEMDALREIEGNEMNVLVGDSQPVVDPTTLSGEPVRTWKKKGQKRTTRRVMMRPTTAARKTRDLSEFEGDEFVVADKIVQVEETQASVSDHLQQALDEDITDDLQPLQELNNTDDNETLNYDDLPRNTNAELSDVNSDSDSDELALTPRPKKRRLKPTLPDPGKLIADAIDPLPTKSLGAKKISQQPQVLKQDKALAEQKQKKKNPKEKGTINPNAHSHQNFRSLKIRNKNAKSKGKGRFGRR